MKRDTQPRCSMGIIDDSIDLVTPCFILDVKELERSFKGFYEALSSHFREVTVGYSVKTNSTPYCMQKILKWGGYAEVVSHDEYELAMCCGFRQERIIYNGPMKSKATFLDAVRNGAIVNIETKRELHWLEELEPEAENNYKVGIRLNINISDVSPEDADGNNDNSRFGFSEDTGELLNAINFIAALPNAKLAGLHIHRTAHSRSVRFYENSVRYACAIIKKYNLDLEYLDVGGGYFGIFSGKPTYRQYSDAFYRILNENGLADLRIIVEPGNALVASCFSFLTEVIDVKQVEPDCWFITTDGSRNDIDPFFKKTSYFAEEMRQHSTPCVKQQVVSGCTCLEYDRLFALEDKPLLSIGDRILYRNVGAYTMCLTSLFIRYLPNIYVTDGSGYRLVREKWTAKEFLQKTSIK